MNYYFRVSFNFKVILYVGENHSNYRDLDPLSVHDVRCSNFRFPCISVREWFAALLQWRYLGQPALLPFPWLLFNMLHSPFHSTPSHVTDLRCSFYKPFALRVQGTAGLSGLWWETDHFFWAGWGCAIFWGVSCFLTLRLCMIFFLVSKYLVQDVKRMTWILESTWSFVCLFVCLFFPWLSLHDFFFFSSFCSSFYAGPLVLNLFFWKLPNPPPCRIVFYALGKEFQPL